MWRLFRRVFSGDLTGVHAGRLVLQGAVLGIGMVVGYAAVLAFILGALGGATIMAIYWASSAHSGASIFVAILSCVLLLCGLPLLWYCYCSKTARRAADYAAGGYVKTNFEW